MFVQKWGQHTDYKHIGMQHLKYQKIDFIFSEEIKEIPALGFWYCKKKKCKIILKK